MMMIFDVLGELENENFAAAAIFQAATSALLFYRTFHGLTLKVFSNNIFFNLMLLSSIFKC